ncbi:hypothetical protein [Paludibaculum fermentans]|uniref:Uncharacterized protein n=1 Tax=Paludibaculum fermentans TaxID=1473598 RepID=A0A7S7NTI3_PALFE|nr:hypothetical protein [Paludibaculum fermentans]QOY88979.1 hypothetical protein IRI77_03190 [Paludibaculum fermentans]
MASQMVLFFVSLGSYQVGVRGGIVKFSRLLMMFVTRGVGFVSGHG